MKQLKIILYLLLIVALLTDIYVCFFYYFQIYQQEYTLLRWVLHATVLALINGLLYLSGFRNTDKSLRISFGIFFGLEVMMFTYNYRRNDRDLLENGEYVIGYVIDKKATKGSWDVVYNFQLNGQIYKAELGVTERDEIRKIHIGDSALICYSFLHPRINEVIKKY
jgi:uncharacterized membrane protein